MADGFRSGGSSSFSRKIGQDETVLKLVGLVSLLLFILFGLWSLYGPVPTFGGPQPGPVISEFMAANTSTLADKDGDHSDWIEIHNGSKMDVNLGGWYLTDDERDLTKWQFPPTILPAEGYLVVFSSGKYRAIAGSELHTNFEIDSSGNYLALIKPDGATVAWEHAPETPQPFEDLSYPWAARLMGRRGIEPKFPPQFADVSYGLDGANNERYFTEPTPGAINGTAKVDRGPIIYNVNHTPNLPTSSDAITITATVRESLAPVTMVDLHYRIMFGNTIAVPMFDDGIHGDGAAGDGVYGATIPSSTHQPGEMVRYYVLATDHDNRSSRWPLFNDPTNSPEYLGTTIADPSVVSALPVLYWFVQDPGGAETDQGTLASLFYDGILYDNVFVRPRGGGSVDGPGWKSRAWPKKSFKFDFNQGFHFQFSPDETPVEELNLNSTYSDKAYIRQVLAWETMREAGVPASLSFPMYVQQNGRFHSVGIFVEQVDERYLEELGLDPAGALYKIDNPATSANDGAKKRTRLDEGNGDLQALLDGIHLPEPARTSYLFDHLNLPAVINYLAASTIMHDNDHISTNYYLYRDTEGTGEWMFLPWDKDLTFGRNNVKGDTNTLDDTIWADTDPYSHPLVGSSSYRKAGGGWNRLMDALYASPAIREMYLRRLRTLMDQFLQPPGTSSDQLWYEGRIDELEALMQPDVSLDADRWPHQWGIPQTFSEAIDILKREYLAVRRTHLYETHGPGNNGIIPESQPEVAEVRFGEAESDPASGNQDEEYFTLVNSNAFAVDISGWTVSGDIAYVFAPGVVIPSGGTLYVSPDTNAFRNRATSPSGGEGRFVQGNYRGRLSNGLGLLTLINASGEVVTRTILFGPSQSSDRSP